MRDDWCAQDCDAMPIGDRVAGMIADGLLATALVLTVVVSVVEEDRDD